MVLCLISLLPSYLGFVQGSLQNDHAAALENKHMAGGLTENTFAELVPDAIRNYRISGEKNTLPQTAPNTSKANHGNRSRQTISQNRRLDDQELADFLIISTVEGSLHACLRSTGEELWSLKGEGSAVKVSAHSETETEDDMKWIVEPIGDGNLYYYTQESGLQVSNLD